MAAQEIRPSQLLCDSPWQAVPVGDTVGSRGVAKGERPVLLRRVAIVAGAWRLLQCSCFGIVITKRLWQGP